MKESGVQMRISGGLPVLSSIGDTATATYTVLKHILIKPNEGCETNIILIAVVSIL